MPHRGPRTGPFLTASLAALAASMALTAGCLYLTHRAGGLIVHALLAALTASTLAAGLVWAGVRRQRLRFSLEKEDNLPASPVDFDSALAAAGLCLWDWDLLADRIRWSANAQEMLGAPPAADFESFLTLTAAEDRPGVRDAFRAGLEDQRHADCRAIFRLAGRPARWVEIRGRLCRDKEGKPMSLSGALSETVPRRSSANESLTPALSRLGHRLRSPAVEIMGVVELLQDTKLDEEQRSYVQSLVRAARSLLSALDELAALQGGGVSAPAEAPPGQRPVGPARALSVLLVEDNAVNQQVLEILVRQAGHQVRTAANGREAVEAVEQEKFDLVLMDVQMPEMDGLRATRLIRAREKAVGGRIPIVAVTANASPGERERCLAAGMDDYLAKPVRGPDLLAMITRLFGRGEAAPVAAAAATDWLGALRSMGLDTPAIVRLVQTFLQTTPERLDGLRRALESQDAAAVQATAHMLKGSLAVFAARPAMAAAVKLEESARQGRLEGGAQGLAELEAQMQPLLEAMSGYLQTVA